MERAVFEFGGVPFGRSKVVVWKSSSDVCFTRFRTFHLVVVLCRIVTVYTKILYFTTLIIQIRLDSNDYLIVDHIFLFLGIKIDGNDTGLVL